MIRGNLRLRLVRASSLVALASSLSCQPASGDSQPSPAGEAPFLAELVASEASGAGITPPFSPTVHDYYVRCGPGANALTVSMTASPGAETVLLEPTRSASASSQTLQVSVQEGGAIVAAATGRGARSEYWVRCLPHDFPEIRMTSYPAAGAPPPGYYLVGNLGSVVGARGYAMVLDGDGVPVWFHLAGRGVYDVDTLEPGVISFEAPSSQLSYENHRLRPLETTYVRALGAAVDEHELRRLPSGNYLVISSPAIGHVDLTGLTLPLATGGTQSFGPDSYIRQCLIEEVDPAGRVLWQWAATDHFDPLKDMRYIFPYWTTVGEPLIVEPFHCNSIDVDSSGNLLVSARHMDSVFYIERATGKVLWKMGGASYSKDDAVYVPVADAFYRQHDARFQADWKPTCGGRSGRGGISLFDDETELPGPARGVVYDVVVGSSACAGSGTSGATVRWQYQGSGPVKAAGSMRVLPEGGAIVSWGTAPGFIFTELDARGHDVRELHFDDGSCTYRAVKVPVTAFDLNDLRSAAGLDPPPDAGSGDAAAIEPPPADSGTSGGTPDASVE